MFALASNRPWNRALGHRLQERTGARFRLIDTPSALTAERLDADGIEAAFFPHSSHKIPASVFGSFECVIFHMTDVPYGRGGSPLQNLILRGHEDTVISALRCVEAMDAGPVYLKRPLHLNGSAEENRIRMLDVTGYPPAFIHFGPFRIEFRHASRRTDAAEADVRIDCRDSREDV